MDDMPVLGRGDDNRLVKLLMAQYDAPAYVRRARRVEEALDQLLGRCRQQRDQWLQMVRLRLGRLQALAGDWSRLRLGLAGEEQISVLRCLQEMLQPRLHLWLEPAISPRRLQRALQELRASILTFNRRWQSFLQTVDLSAVNASREAYNRYYLLEKECALRSARLARQGFRRLEPFRLEDLMALLPPLPVPE